MRARLILWPLVLVTSLGMLPASAATSLTPVAVPDSKPVVQFEGSGWGHSVGMSQYGAYAQSQAGRGWRTILSHYYPGADFATTDNPEMRVGLSEGRASFDVEVPSSAPRKVLWKTCDAGANWSDCTLRVNQPPGSTYRVERNGSTLVIRDVGQTCASDNPSCNVVKKVPLSDGGSIRVRPTSGDTHVFAHNPNGGDKAYRWGQLEFSAKPGSSTWLRLVLAELPLELYLRGLGEVPSSWGDNGGMHALRAQATAARTYGLRFFESTTSSASGDCACHLGATPRHQVYVGYSKELDHYGDLWVQSVKDTAGTVLRHNGALISTVYSSSHAVRSENVEDSWAFGTSAIPYLRSVDDSWSADVDPGPSRYEGWSCSASNSAVASYLDSGVSRITAVAEGGGRTKGGTPYLLRVKGLDGDGNVVGVDWSGPTKGIAGASLRYDADRRVGLSVECPVRATKTNPSGEGTLPSQQLSRVGLAPFVDDDGSVHETNIARVAAAGITAGCSANGKRFCPADALRRDQMATLLMRSFEELEPIDGTRFSDTPEGNIHTPAINAIFEAGITNGCAPEKYCPRDSVTRAELATFLVRAIDGLEPADGTRFSDVAEGSTHAGTIAALADAGITNGCGGDKYCPHRAVTRQEMASLLVRALTWRP